MRMRPFAVAVFVGLALATAQPQQFKLKIIAINDLHGNLQSPGTMRANADSPVVPVGGVDMADPPVMFTFRLSDLKE